MFYDQRRVRRCAPLGQAVQKLGVSLLDVLDGSGPDKTGGGAAANISVTDKPGAGASLVKAEIGQSGDGAKSNKTMIDVKARLTEKLAKPLEQLWTALARHK